MDEKTALAKIAPAQFRLVPSSLGDAMEMAKLIAGSDLCPKAYRGKPADCIVAYEYGAALGLSWMQALRAVAVINGVSSLFGDALPALIYASGQCERFHETFTGKPYEDDYTAVCAMKRRGMPDEVVRTFSVADAKRASLWGKQGPWSQYTNRMLQFRARGFAARDAFADKLSGLILAEEAQDYPDAIEGTVVSSTVVPPATSAYDRLSEALKANIEKAFETLALAPGLRIAKLTEFLTTDVEPEEGAQALLLWCRDEYAKRKTGKAVDRKGPENGRTKKAETSDSATGGARRPDSERSSELHPVSDAVDVQPQAETSTPAQASLKADEIFKQGFSGPNVATPGEPDTSLGF
jgi:hypothetical protein